MESKELKELREKEEELRTQLLTQIESSAKNMLDFPRADHSSSMIRVSEIRSRLNEVRGRIKINRGTAAYRTHYKMMTVKVENHQGQKLIIPRNSNGLNCLFDYLASDQSKKFHLANPGIKVDTIEPDEKKDAFLVSIKLATYDVYLDAAHYCNKHLKVELSDEQLMGILSELESGMTTAVDAFKKIRG